MRAEVEAALKLRERGTQDLLFRPATRTATGKFAVNHDGRHAADSVLLGVETTSAFCMS